MSSKRFLGSPSRKKMNVQYPSSFTLGFPCRTRPHHHSWHLRPRQGGPCVSDGAEVHRVRRPWSFLFETRVYLIHGEGRGISKYGGVVRKVFYGVDVRGRDPWWELQTSGKVTKERFPMYKRRHESNQSSDYLALPRNSLIHQSKFSVSLLWFDCA